MTVLLRCLFSCVAMASIHWQSETMCAAAIVPIAVDATKAFQTVMVDLGTTVQAELRNVTVPIHNSAETTQIIVHVDISCGCFTLDSIDGFVMQPRSSLNLQADLSNASWHVTDPSVTVHGRDAATGREWAIQATFHANIVRKVGLLAPSFAMRHNEVDNSLSVRIPIFLPDASPTRPPQVTIDGIDDRFTVTTEWDSTHWNIFVHARRPLDCRGQWPRTYLLTVGDRSKQFSATVEEPAPHLMSHVRPRMIRLDRSPAQSTSTLFVRGQLHNAAPTQITDIHTSQPIAFQYMSGQVSLSVPSFPNTTSGLLRISFDPSDQCAFNIPWYR